MFVHLSLIGALLRGPVTLWLDSDFRKFWMVSLKGWKLTALCSSTPKYRRTELINLQQALRWDITLAVHNGQIPVYPWTIHIVTTLVTTNPSLYIVRIAPPTISPFPLSCPLGCCRCCSFNSYLGNGRVWGCKAPIQSRSKNVFAGFRRFTRCWEEC